jgi:hypothetical protein
MFDVKWREFITLLGGAAIECLAPQADQKNLKRIVREP